MVSAKFPPALTLVTRARLHLKHFALPQKTIALSMFMLYSANTGDMSKAAPKTLCSPTKNYCTFNVHVVQNTIIFDLRPYRLPSDCQFDTSPFTLSTLITNSQLCLLNQYVIQHDTSHHTSCPLILSRQGQARCAV